MSREESEYCEDDPRPRFLCLCSCLCWTSRSVLACVCSPGKGREPRSLPCPSGRSGTERTFSLPVIAAQKLVCPPSLGSACGLLVQPTSALTTWSPCAIISTPAAFMPPPEGPWANRMLSSPLPLYSARCDESGESWHDISVLAILEAASDLGPGAGVVSAVCVLVVLAVLGCKTAIGVLLCDTHLSFFKLDALSSTALPRSAMPNGSSLSLGPLGPVCGLWEERASALCCAWHVPRMSVQHASALARASASPSGLTSTSCRRSSNFLISLSCREMAVWKRHQRAWSGLFSRALQAWHAFTSCGLAQRRLKLLDPGLPCPLAALQLAETKLWRNTCAANHAVVVDEPPDSGTQAHQ